MTTPASTVTLVAPFEWTADPRGTFRGQMTLAAEPGDRRVYLVALQLELRGPNISADLYRTLPVTAIADGIRRAALGEARKGGDRRLAALLAGPPRAGRKTRLEPGHLAEVLAFHGAEAAAGNPTPTQAVAARWGVSRALAKRWLARARRAALTDHHPETQGVTTAKLVAVTPTQAAPRHARLQERGGPASAASSGAGPVAIQV